VRRRQNHNRAQLVLELERQSLQPLWAANPKGLIEALADLLLEALGTEKVTTTGGVDEHQDHA
jgi:hypothetical protein